ncbi:MAG: FG-GAP-like repeat-containing protein [Planctomycetes bacterium]|nr:FG-GAP-like repeat-containing protein [Planctomycetota bacterium]
MRDPDRGLDPKLRAKLGLVDAKLDVWSVERGATAIEARLAELSRAWSAADAGGGDVEFDSSLSAWLAPTLRVGPLAAAARAEANPPPSERAWSLTRELEPSGAEPAPFVEALASWRKTFTGPSRLDCELFGVVERPGSPPTLETTIRVQASGVVANARAQHDATWTCVWSVADDSLRLVELRVTSFDAATLPGGAAPPFVDVTESLFEDPELYRTRFAPGLDRWRATLPSSVSPGALGHHGLAVGDVNGDGLEDVYVCRPGGLPNQLLLHTADHRLRDVSAEAGVDFLDFTSSALLVDLDRDGDRDLVLAASVGLVFLANDGHGRFERKLEIERSLATSLSAADYDGDGDLDVYVCSYLSPYEQNGLPVPYHDANNGEANQLWRNDVANGASSDGNAWKFVDVTKEVGLDEHNRRFSFAAAWEDFDEDGDQDLYVANDFGRKNLYRNDDGRFRDVAPELAADDVSAGMGVDWGDFDGDGWLDAYTTNMCTRAGSRLTCSPGFRATRGGADEHDYRAHAMGNTLLANRGGKRFEDVAEASGTAFGRWGWGAIFVDFDGDGALDLFAPNGFASDTREPDLDSFFWRQVVLQSPADDSGARDDYALGWRAINRLMRQGYSWNGHERNVALWNVGDGRFVDVSAAAGLDHPDDARAAVRIDWDHDGDEDLFLTNRNAPMLRMLENRRATEHAWIAFELASRDPRRTTIGARVVVSTDDRRTQRLTQRAGHGYLTQSSSRLVFGLGRASVTSVSVRWPSGETESFGAPSARSAHRLLQGSGTAQPLAARAQREFRETSYAAPRLAATRTVLTTPLGLPRLALETADGRAASLFGITMQGPQGTGRPLVLLLWSREDLESLRLLHRFAEEKATLEAAGLAQVLSLCVDVGAGTGAEDDREARTRALEAWSAANWPFSRGFASEEALQVLELVLAALHDDARGLFTPVAFLVDPTGRLVATYAGAFEPATLARDAALVGADDAARLAAAVPFPGRWLAKSLSASDPDVAARLAQHGLERPASEYALAKLEVRKTSNADVAVQVGIALHEQGRRAEAIVQYRRALEVDPAHALAAQSLALALHESGDLDGALAAYREALKLAPGHADTRFNLGLLCLQRNDVAGAKQELAALEKLSPEHAVALAEKLRAFERR